jgi:hypothetical protein
VFRLESQPHGTGHASESRGCTSLALWVVDCADERTKAGYADKMQAIPFVREPFDAVLRDEAAQARRQEEWLRRTRARP